MRNIRLTLAYDGTGYVGWQIQPNGISVQATVEAAIERLTGSRPSLIAAGRTDAGVHALGQVANFQTESTIPREGFRAGLGTFLPRDILVLDADEVPLSFHATHCARRKRYRYVILNARAGYPFLRHYAHEFHVPLCEQAMHEAGQELLGKHDFRAFESHHPNTSSSVRTVLELSVGRHAGWPTWTQNAPCAGTAGPRSIPTDSKVDDFIWIDIVADGFLYNMVRAIAGTLIRVGEGKWGPSDLRRILQGGDRKQAGATAPACGLYLVSVEYQPHAADSNPEPAAVEAQRGGPP
jgi:tRNA pseudouridine38-40 synthase